MLRQLLRPVVRNVGQRGTRAYGHGSEIKRATMDELPVPQGSWQEAYDAKQKKYNLILAAGLIYAVGTLGYVFGTNAIFWNWAPPVPKDEKK